MAANLAGVQEIIAEKSVRADYSRFTMIGGALAAVGLVLLAVSLFGAQSERTWQAFHVNWVFFTGLTFGSIVITAVHKIANARWSGLVLRLSQAAAAFVPVILIGFVLIFTVGYDHIYGHMSEELHGLGHGKALWLSHGWMAARLAIALGAMTWVGFKLIKADMLPDMALSRDKVSGARQAMFDRMLKGYDAQANHTRIYRLAPIFAVIYALAMTAVAFDGIMALQPHWFSNLLGGWYFMGAFLAGNMLLALNILYARKAVGIGEYISEKQRHDQGKLCFGFTVFWMYLLWAQFLVIWYGNLPEETGFVFTRLWGEWRPIGAAVFVGVFLIPFTGLLSVGAKKTPFTMTLFAGISLASLWLERYLLVIPSISHENGPHFGLPELAPTLAFVGLFLVAYGWFAKTYPMVSPVRAMITLQREAAH